MATSASQPKAILLVPLRPPYHCPICLPVYRDYVNHAGLSRHLRRIHGGHLAFECQACGVRSLKLKKLKLHQAKSASCFSQLPALSPNHSARDPKLRGKIPNNVRVCSNPDDIDSASQDSANSDCNQSTITPPSTTTQRTRRRRKRNPTHQQPVTQATPPTPSPPDPCNAQTTPPAAENSRDMPPLVRRPRPSLSPASTADSNLGATPSISLPTGLTTSSPQPTAAIPAPLISTDPPPQPTGIITCPVDCRTNASQHQPSLSDSHQSAPTTSSTPPPWVTAWCE
ncbi:uncharacterized protein [Centruroides vittatus]|uniref:uncharacterized protein n=1 Tax=Centruroides vittatus TaxID=120091 RepID=UPI00350F5F86